MIRIPPLHSHVKVTWIDSMSKQGSAWTSSSDIQEWVDGLGTISNVGFILHKDEKHLTLCSGYYGEGKGLSGVLGVFSIPVGCIQTIKRIK